MSGYLSVCRGGKGIGIEGGRPLIWHDGLGDTIPKGVAQEEEGDWLWKRIEARSVLERKLSYLEELHGLPPAYRPVLLWLTGKKKKKSIFLFFIENVGEGDKIRLKIDLSEGWWERILGEVEAG